MTRRARRLDPITRRTFLKSAAYASVGAGLLAAGGGRALASARPLADDGAVRLSQTRGGILRVAFSDGNTGDTLDPNLQDNFWTPPMFATMYDTITRFDEDFQAQPHLAESWEPSDDAMTWIFRLRTDVEFHDGSLMTANDVVWSLRRAMDPESGTALVTLLGDVVEPGSITAEDDHTVRFDLKVPFVFLPNPLATRYAKVLKADTPDDVIRSAPNGTGPFRFKEFTPGQSFAATRNDAYWKEGRPFVDEIQMTNIPESASKLEALLAGQADIIDNVEFATGRLLEADPNVAPAAYFDSAWHPLILDLNAAPFDDPDVVAAFKLGIDRQDIIDRVYSGFATLGYDSIIPASDPYFPADVPEPVFDPDAAREALRSAGYGDGLKLDFPLFTVFGFDSNNNAAVLKEQLQQVGIEFDIQEGGPTFWDAVWLNEPFYLPDWNRRHAAEGFPLLYSCEGVWNQTHFCDPEVDQKIVDAASTTDFGEQQQLYGDIIRTLIEEDGLVLGAYAPRLHGKAAALDGLILNSTDFMNFEDVSLG